MTPGRWRLGQRNRTGPPQHRCAGRKGGAICRRRGARDAVSRCRVDQIGGVLNIACRFSPDLALTGKSRRRGCRRQRMLVMVVEVAVTMTMRMTRPVRMFMVMRMEDNLDPAPESGGDPAQWRQRRHMISLFEAGDHGFGHADPFGELLLCLSCRLPKLTKTARALGRDDRAVLGDRATRQGAGCSRHWPDLAKLLRGGNFGFSGDGDGSCGTGVRQIAQSGPREELQT